MSRITITDLDAVTQVTELSEVELTATKGGFLFLKLIFGGFLHRPVVYHHPKHYHYKHH